MFSATTMGQAGAGGGTWYGDRASPTGGNWTNAAVISRTPGFSQQNVRNVRSKEYAVDSGNITSDNCIALEEPGNIVSGTRFAEPPADYSEASHPRIKINCCLLAGGIDCDTIGEKERNPNPMLLVATG